MMDGKYVELTERLIGCFYSVYNELGYGYNESVYASAMEIVFRERAIAARKEHAVDVIYHDQRIASYRLDFLVDDKVVLELKAGPNLNPAAKSQLITYLRCSNKSVGLILYFGPKPVVKRVVL